MEPIHSARMIGRDDVAVADVTALQTGEWRSWPQRARICRPIRGTRRGRVVCMARRPDTRCRGHHEDAITVGAIAAGACESRPLRRDEYAVGMQIGHRRLSLPRDVRRQQLVSVQDPERGPAVDRNDGRHQRHGFRVFAREGRPPAHFIAVDLLHIAQPWNGRRALARTDGQVASWRSDLDDGRIPEFAGPRGPARQNARRARQEKSGSHSDLASVSP